MGGGSEREKRQACGNGRQVEEAGAQGSDGQQGRERQQRPGLRSSRSDLALEGFPPEGAWYGCLERCAESHSEAASKGS